MRTAQILAIGTELTLGQSVDTNSAWLARELAALGFRSHQHTVVGDDLPRIVAAIRRAADEADVVLCTGGLGPTDDDLTRAALAEAAGVDLTEDAESLRQIEAYFAARRREMPPRNRVQAQLPRGAAVLPNNCGTAPGMSIRIGRAAVFSMPGVPYEMKAMFAAHVAPALQKLGGAGRVIRTRLVRTCGRPEAEVNDLLGDLMQRGRNPEVGTAAAMGEITVRINAEADSPAAADALLEPVEADIRSRLGWAVFGGGDDTLATAAGRLLSERRQTVAVAESCTGGLVGALFTDTPGSSAYFQGGLLVYSNELKMKLAGVPEKTLADHGAVSPQTAEALARGVRERCGVDYGLSVTGIAGPGGGTEEKPVGLVYLGLADSRGVISRELRLGQHHPRDIIRAWSARAAINLLRLRLIGHL
jgi:nicotinamide-nucleotide amidase